MNPNSILGRYLSKQIILNFLGVLLMVLGLIIVVNSLRAYLVSKRNSEIQNA